MQDRLRTATHVAERQLELRRKVESWKEFAGVQCSQHLADALTVFHSEIENAVANLEQANRESDQWVATYYTPDMMADATEEIEVAKIAEHIKPLYNQMLLYCQDMRITPQAVIRNWPQTPQTETANTIREDRERKE